MYTVHSIVCIDWLSRLSVKLVLKCEVHNYFPQCNVFYLIFHFQFDKSNIVLIVHLIVLYMLNLWFINLVIFIIYRYDICNDVFNYLKVTVQINVVHLSFLVIKETGKKSIHFYKKYDYKKYNENFSTSVVIIMFNILISEGSCDTEDWSNDAENSALQLLQEYNYNILPK